MNSVGSATEHHPIFARFPRWEGATETGFEYDFLGVRTRREWFGVGGGTVPSPRRPPLPEVNEEYFEWVDLLEAVDAADRVFTMVELGAGWGRWLMRGAAAANALGKTVRLIGVEAEPTHFVWMKQHFDDNGVPPASLDLREAAVAGSPGYVNFHVGDPAAWYGQAIDRDASPTRGFRGLGETVRRSWRRSQGRARRIVKMRAIALGPLLADLPRVDLIDLDVQGVEAEVLEAAADELAARVRRVHIGTHSSQNEQRCYDLFASMGWRNLNNFAVGITAETKWGLVAFQDGVQSWCNERAVT